MTEKSKALLLLHFIVFIWGFTGILGNEINLDSPYLVLWRTFIAAISLSIYALWSKHDLILPLKEILLIALVGCITAAHWIFFFGSIKVSNVSTALAVISTTSFFVAIVAPLINKRPFSKLEFLLGVMVITGLSIIFRFEPDYELGIIFSLIAALGAAIFSSINASLVKKFPPLTIAFYEMWAGCLAVLLYLIISQKSLQPLFSISSKDFVLLMILGVFATAFAFLAGIKVMKVVSPFTCALTINLEPLYTIVFALLLYGESEFMSPQFYLGAVIILSTLFIELFAKRRHKKSASKRRHF